MHAFIFFYHIDVDVVENHEKMQLLDFDVSESVLSHWSSFPYFECFSVCEIDN
jgi:hypothetical protein